MAAEIILDPARGMQEQMREILDLAGSGEQGDLNRDVAAINWYPRPDKPHGGVVRVPDHVAEAHSARMAELRAADEAATDDSDLDEGDEAPNGGEGSPSGTEEPASRRGRRKAAASTSGDGGGSA